jgi:uncharacterized protein
VIWRDALVEYIRLEARPLEKFSHQPRLYSLIREIGTGLDFDDDVVFAAVWLHDLGVFYGHRPEDLEALARWDNTAYAMERAPAILRGFGFPEHKVPAVVEAIRTHQLSGEPASIEATLLRDADVLEQLGAVGILRTVCKIGRDTRFATFADAIRSLQKTLDSLPSLIRLDSARRLAEPRVAELRAFLAAAHAESGGALD